LTKFLALQIQRGCLNAAVVMRVSWSDAEKVCSEWRRQWIWPRPIVVYTNAVIYDGGLNIALSVLYGAEHH